MRDWRLGDARALVRHTNDERVQRDLSDEFQLPSTLYAAARFILWMQSMRPPTCFAIAVGDEPVGGIGYRLQDGLGRVGAEIGYWVSVSWWGQGIATAALTAITAHAFQSRAELSRLYALSLAGNRASARVLQKVGYRLEGILRRPTLQDGKLVDQVLHAIRREDLQSFLVYPNGEQVESNVSLPKRDSFGDASYGATSSAFDGPVGTLDRLRRDWLHRRERTETVVERHSSADRQPELQRYTHLCH